MKHIRLYESDNELKHEVHRFLDTGVIQKETWRNADDQLHREDGPASIIYYPDGTKQWEHWFLNGESHRVGGPADLLWKEGYLGYEAWKQHGRFHRENGPATTTYTKLGTGLMKKWYLNGYSYPEKRWAYLMLDKWSDLELAEIAEQATEAGQIVRASGKLPDWAQSWLDVFN
jgi:hypothetical protein